MFRLSSTLPALLLLSGCFDASEEEGPQLLAPEQVEFYWDASFNGYADNLGALVPMDLMVYDGVSGEALEAVRLDISLAGGEGLVVPPEALGFLDVEECAECDFVWDSYRDQYFVLPEGDLALDNSLSLETDDTGLARVYVFVDAVDDHGFGNSRLDVQIGMGDISQTVVLVAE
jgi:hypothetical protein